MLKVGRSFCFTGKLQRIVSQGSAAAACGGKEGGKCCSRIWRTAPSVRSEQELSDGLAFQRVEILSAFAVEYGIETWPMHVTGNTNLIRSAELPSNIESSQSARNRLGALKCTIGD